MNKIGKIFLIATLRSLGAFSLIGTYILIDHGNFIAILTAIIGVLLFDIAHGLNKTNVVPNSDDPEVKSDEEKKP